MVWHRNVRKIHRFQSLNFSKMTDALRHYCLIWAAGKKLCMHDSTLRIFFIALRRSLCQATWIISRGERHIMLCNSIDLFSSLGEIRARVVFFAKNAEVNACFHRRKIHVPAREIRARVVFVVVVVFFCLFVCLFVCFVCLFVCLFLIVFLCVWVCCFFVCLFFFWGGVFLVLFSYVSFLFFFASGSETFFFAGEFHLEVGGAQFAPFCHLFSVEKRGGWHEHERNCWGL